MGIKHEHNIINNIIVCEYENDNILKGINFLVSVLKPFVPTVCIFWFWFWFRIWLFRIFEFSVFVFSHEFAFWFESLSLSLNFFKVRLKDSIFLIVSSIFSSFIFVTFSNPSPIFSFVICNNNEYKTQKKTIKPE